MLSDEMLEFSSFRPSLFFVRSIAVVVAAFLGFVVVFFGSGFCSCTVSRIGFDDWVLTLTFEISKIKLIVHMIGNLFYYSINNSLTRIS